MANNIATGPDANLNYILQVQRDSQSEGKISEITKIQPGVSIHADPALQIKGHWRSPAGHLFELDITAEGEGNWIGLHMTMGDVDLTHAGIIGFACRSVAPSIKVLRACVRSGLPEGGFEDCFFPKRILAHPDPSSHLDVLETNLNANLPKTAPWREFILFLPQHSFRWDLHDLRLFIV